MQRDLHKEDVMERLRGMEIPWEKSRDDVWAGIESKLGHVAPVKRKMIPIVVRYAAAALLVLAIATGAFMRLFHTEVITQTGEFVSHQLPDGSVIDMNAGSSLSYHPYWFSISRTLDFEGEGFFQVQKGKQFTVESDLGSTRVLGTSFTVYSRHDNYAVTCYTGKVGVTVEEAKVILNPSELASYNPDRGLVKEQVNHLNEPAPWKNGLYSFTAADIQDVFREIEQYYNISISWDQNVNHTYSGDLDFRLGVEKTLRLVCTPFTLTFVKISEGKYEVLGHE